MTAKVKTLIVAATLIIKKRNSNNEKSPTQTYRAFGHFTRLNLRKVGYLILIMEKRHQLIMFAFNHLETFNRA